MDRCGRSVAYSIQIVPELVRDEGVALAVEVHSIFEDEALEPGQVRVAFEYISVDAGTRTMLRGEGFHAQNLGHG